MVSYRNIWLSHFNFPTYPTYSTRQAMAPVGLVSRSSSLSQQLQRRIQTPSGGCQCARTRFKKCTTRVGRLTWTHKEASGTADRRGSALCASQQASPTILASTVSCKACKNFATHAGNGPQPGLGWCAAPQLR